MRALGRRLALAAAALAPAILASPAVLACPVCYGKADAPVLQGAEMSVLFMMALTYLLLACGVVGFLVLRHRRRQLDRSTEPLQANL